MRVMVIDDERSNRAILQAALGAYGCAVEVFERADLAVEAVPRVQPDLVLLDWRLPGLAGADAVRALRDRTAAPIVIITAYATPDHRADIAAAAPDGVLTKPFDFDALEALVDRCRR